MPNSNHIDRVINAYDTAIDYEMQKNPEETDLDLVDEYVDMRLQLQGKSESSEIYATKFALSAFQKKVAMQKRTFAKRKRRYIQIAAASIAVMLSITTLIVCQMIYGLQQKHILPKADKGYHSYEEFSAEEGISTLYPQEKKLKNTEYPILRYDSQGATQIWFLFDDGTAMTLYLENAPFSRNLLNRDADVRQTIVNDRIYYVQKSSKNLQAILFDGSYVYEFLATAEQSLIETALCLR